MKETRIFPEPWRVKTVERIELLSRDERLERLKAADWNVFLVKARDVFIDLLTDSGTSAMSDAQWGALMRGDESYAYARSWERFETAVKEVTGFAHVLPTHQGRASEHLLFGALLKKGDVVPSNNHFDTTRANIEALGCTALDLVIAEGKDPQKIHPFKGNMDVDKLEALLRKKRGRVPFCMLTVTNNTGGGQPVAMENIFQVSAVCRRHGIPLFLDACRYAENAYFIKLRGESYGDVPIPKIAREMFSYADGCTMSAKKDGLANIGGFIGLNSPELFETVKSHVILKEGFITYGGLAGRDLEAVAVGLLEAQDEEYLRFRIEQVRFFGEMLKENGARILEPAGGHAIYLDALQMLPHIPQEKFPAQALTVALYLEGGVRGVEIGSVMFAQKDPKTGKIKYPPMELVRLAVPRRVYTNDHLAYVAEVMAEVMRRKEKLPGFRITWEPPRLRHFTARFEPLRALD
jgi:tryptophanase